MSDPGDRKITDASARLPGSAALAPPPPLMSASILKVSDGDKGPTGRVFRSEDNILHLIGGSNDVATLYTEAGFRKSVDTPAWKKLLTERSSAVRQLGSAFIQFLVPEKMTVLPLGDSDRSKVFPGVDAKEIVPPGRRFIEQTQMTSIVYPEQFLRDQTAKLPIYLPTDSHWTWQGAFSAFQVLMIALRRRPDFTKFVTLPKTTLRYHGDLWEPHFADIPPDPFERITLPSALRRVYANQLIGLKEKLKPKDEGGLHMGSHCIFHNSAAELPETVVLFGSSFSECRLGPSLLTSVFSYYFATVHFIWSTSVDLDYVERHRPAITVAELPERFLTFRPIDAVPVEEASADKMRAWRNRNAGVKS